MYNKSYGQRKQYGDQSNKAIYDIRDNVDAQTRRISGLAKTIRQLYEYIVIIEDVLQERGCISGSELKRKHSLSHAGSGKKQIPVLQDGITGDEDKRVCVDKRSGRYGMVYLHDKRQTPDAEATAKRTTFDVSPPRRQDSDPAISEKE